MELIYSVNDIFTKYLVGNDKFTIPAYQRGYKWKTNDIEQLLNDINAFQTHEDDDVFYCLQNITLVRDGDSYNVVDGQQRLTTLALMLAYLGETKQIKGKLQYNIRKETQQFLEKYIFSQELINFKNNQPNSRLLEWDQLGIKDDDEYNYQDIFYLYNAYRTIQIWFTDHDDVKKDMIEKIKNRVKLIVNLPQISSSQELELFDNLNGKRVSLDGADLIRAMIITRVARKEVEDIADTTKRDVMLNENRVKNGLKLDEISKWWCKQERQDFFDIFVKNINSKGENIIFDNHKYPIDILYKLYIQTTVANKSLSVNKDICKGSGTIKLQYFESSENILKVFSQIQDIQRLVEYWYDDPDLYHLVQYSAIYLKKTFNELTNLWYNKNRTSFISALKNEIKKNDIIKLALQATDDNGNSLSEEQMNFNENWYDGDNTDMMPIMVLHDIIRIMKSKDTKFPIANLDPSHFVAVKEDKEHIFPQTPLEKGYDKDTLKYYIEVAYKCGYSSSTFTKEEVLKTVEKYHEQISSHEGFRIWFNHKLTTDIMPINSLGNVCILQGRVNRSYGNDFFAQKHYDIMRKSSEGEYIRPHVLDAFSKTMASDNQRKDFTYMQQWSKEDIFARRKYIVSMLKDYLG